MSSTSYTVVFSIVFFFSGTIAGNENEVCYEELGCFSQHKSIKRFSYLPPQRPETIGTSFQLFTRGNLNGTRIKIWPSIELKDSNYDGGRWNIFIVHGFAGSHTDNWMLDMKDTFLQKMDANIILVGWSPKMPYYSQAASNTRVVGAEMGRLGMYLIKEKDASPERFHIIGHSVGAHAAAFMAKRIPGVSRLTGLDPAHLYFADEIPAMKFHQSDAMFVEAIHTDAKPVFPFIGMSLYQPVGHVDFYINGGWDQPGCLYPIDALLKGHVDDGFQNVVNAFFAIGNIQSYIRGRIPNSLFLNITKAVLWHIVCPHFRSCLYYTEAIRNENCTFWGRARSSTSTILSILSRGRLSRNLISPSDCSLKTCIPLGMHTPEFPARGSFHVATSKISPFCIKENTVDQLMAEELNYYKKKKKL